MTRFKLKSLSRDALLDAMKKAERYRLLNEPREAESICRDVLSADPDNHDALVMLILTLTDCFKERKLLLLDETLSLLERLDDEYERKYYTAVAWERWGKVQLAHNAPGHVVYEWIRKAMDLFEQAERISPTRSAAAVVRWNTCARLLNANDAIRPEQAMTPEPQIIDEEMPMR